MKEETFYTELTAKLATIQKTLNAPKNLTNAFGKYKYRSCEGILEAVKPLLDGVVLTLSDRIIEVGGRCYVEATAMLSNGDNEIIVTASAREAESKKGMDEAQITGAASSYARKYALNGLFCIDDTKDDDFNNKGNKPSKSKSILCESCGVEIVEMNGKTAQWISDYSMANYGKKLCDKCIVIAKAEKEKGEV